MKITFPLTAEANVNMYGGGGSGARPQLLPSDEELAEIEKQRKAEELEIAKNKVKEKPGNKKPAKDDDSDDGDVADEEGDGEEEEGDDAEDEGEAGEESEDDEEEDDEEEATASAAPCSRKIRRVALAADGGLQNVFSGFPGIGKSSVFRDSQGYRVADSDSSTFPKGDAFPANYLTHIQETRPTVDILLVSSHDIVRDEMEEYGIPFYLVYPTMDQKQDYMQRYRERGSPEPFLDLMDKNWDKFITGCQQQDGCTHVVLQKGQYLSDVIFDLL